MSDYKLSEITEIILDLVCAGVEFEDAIIIAKEQVESK